MSRQRPQHPAVRQFLATYEALVLQGAWVPEWDTTVPGAVWIEFEALFLAARQHALIVRFPESLIRVLRHPTQRKLYPRIIRSRRGAPGSAARHYLVQLLPPLEA